MGVAPQRLWGWEPVVTAEERDADGNLLRVTTSRAEPEFTPHQVDLLLASDLLEADIGPHGQLMSEALSSDGDPANRNAKYRFVGKAAPLIDRAEKARLDAQDSYKKKYKDANMNGAIFSVEKVDL